MFQRNEGFIDAIFWKYFVCHFVYLVYKPYEVTDNIINHAKREKLDLHVDWSSIDNVRYKS